MDKLNSIIQLRTVEQILKAVADHEITVEDGYELITDINNRNLSAVMDTLIKSNSSSGGSGCQY